MIREACTEMLDYLKVLGGNTRRLPITPAAILQDPGGNSPSRSELDY